MISDTLLLAYAPHSPPGRYPTPFHPPPFFSWLGPSFFIYFYLFLLDIFDHSGEIKLIISTFRSFVNDSEGKWAVESGCHYLRHDLTSGRTINEKNHSKSFVLYCHWTLNENWISSVKLLTIIETLLANPSFLPDVNDVWSVYKLVGYIYIRGLLLLCLSICQTPNLFPPCCSICIYTSTNWPDIGGVLDVCHSSPQKQKGQPFRSK